MIDERIEIIKGDITKFSCDAIVNSANSSLRRGGGVDGCIHRAAGSYLENECMVLGKCEVGDAKLTQSYDLQAQGIKWIIHAVGPRWLGGERDEARLLAQTYQKSINIALEYACLYEEQMRQILKKYFMGQGLEQEMQWILTYIAQNPIKTIAFPSISTGIYHYPLEEAVTIALQSITEAIRGCNQIEKVSIVCRDQETYEAYSKKIERMSKAKGQGVS